MDAKIESLYQELLALDGEQRRMLFSRFHAFEYGEDDFEEEQDNNTNNSDKPQSPDEEVSTEAEAAQSVRAADGLLSIAGIVKDREPFEFERGDGKTVKW